MSIHEDIVTENRAVVPLYAGFCKVSIHTELIIYGMVLQFKVQDICDEICCRFL